MSRDAFVARFGGIYEHSPWVAERTFDHGLGKEADTAEGLAALMSETMLVASRNAQMALIRAHPDLAGKAAVADELTDASKSEQAGAGLDQCTKEEFAEFQRLNAAYGEKFGFPFILAVAGKTRHDILDAFRQRLENDAESEFAEALSQIDRIARFRLMAIAEAAGDA
jgi:OHCU decarboxylase